MNATHQASLPGKRLRRIARRIKELLTEGKAYPSNLEIPAQIDRLVLRQSQLTA